MRTEKQIYDTILNFAKADEWLNIFGERLIMQKPEDMELFPAEEKGFSYLMLFSDDVKIDLTLLPLDLIDEYFTWDKLVKLLLDKDNRIAQPPIPTDIDYHIQCPSERSFDDLGKNYKFLERHVPIELWEQLMTTYRMDSYTQVWKSLEQCMELFREVSAEVAKRLNYPYSDYDEKISEYVIRQKQKYTIPARMAFDIG